MTKKTKIYCGCIRVIVGFINVADGVSFTIGKVAYIYKRP